MMVGPPCTDGQHRTSLPKQGSSGSCWRADASCRHRVRLGADQPETVGDTRLYGEIIHVVVEQDARSRHDHLAPKTGVQRGRAGDPVPSASAVEKCVCRPASWKRVGVRARGVPAGNRGRSIPLNPTRQVRRIVLVDQPRGTGVNQDPSQRARSAKARFIASVTGGRTRDRSPSISRQSFRGMFRISSTWTPPELGRKTDDLQPR